MDCEQTFLLGSLKVNKKKARKNYIFMDTRTIQDKLKKQQQGLYRWYMIDNLMTGSQLAWIDIKFTSICYSKTYWK